jgi:ArsR family transcriptional regulator
VTNGQPTLNPSVAEVAYFVYSGNVQIKEAIEAFAALAQEHRLAVFRLLVREGPNGLPAGEIADRVAVPSSTLSRHLAHLEQAHLLRSWRVKRQIYYAVDIEGTRRLVAFLMEMLPGTSGDLRIRGRRKLL